EYQKSDSGAKFIICLDILVTRVSAVKEKTNLEHMIVAKIADSLPFPKNMVYPFIQKRQYNLVVKVVETEDTHVWKSIMDNGNENYQAIDINPSRSEEHTSELQ